MSSSLETGPSNPRRSRIPLFPEPQAPIPPAERVSSQYRFDAPQPPTSRTSRAASLTKSLLGLGLRRGPASPKHPQAHWSDSLAATAVTEPSREPPTTPDKPLSSTKADKRKAYVHHSPRLTSPLDPPLSQAQATGPSHRPRVSLPSTDRWCLSYDVAGLDPVPLDDADHPVFASSYRPLSATRPPSPVRAPVAAAVDRARLVPPHAVLVSHWSDGSSVDSSSSSASASVSASGDGEEAGGWEEAEVASSRREVGIYKAALVTVGPRARARASAPVSPADEHEGEVESEQGSAGSSASSSRSSSPSLCGMHARKDSVATQATSAFSSPQVISADGTIFEMCESPPLGASDHHALP